MQYRGKCAACGVGKNHKNFKGCREGRLVPDPCYVALRKRRPAKDDRLCKFVTIPISPMYPHCPGHLHLLLIRDKDLVRHLWMALTGLTLFIDCFHMVSRMLVVCYL